MTKDLIIVLSYCDEQHKIKHLKEVVDKICEFEHDTLLYSKYPIDIEIYKKLTYYIHDKNNPILNNRRLIHWQERNNIRYSHVFNNDWGLAALEQIINSLGFAYALNYRNAYIINYDIEKEHILYFLVDSRIALEEYSATFYPFSDDGFQLTSLSFNISDCYNKLKGHITYNSYNSYDVKYVGENILKFIVDKCQIKYFLQNYKKTPHTVITSHMFRYGDITDRQSIIKNFFSKCFIGYNNSRKENVILISGIKKEIKNITFDFGDVIGFYDEIVHENNLLEIFLGEKKPKKLVVIKINDEEINEIIYENISEDYYYNNTISYI